LCNGELIDKAEYPELHKILLINDLGLKIPSCPDTSNYDSSAWGYASPCYPMTNGEFYISKNGVSDYSAVYNPKTNTMSDLFRNTRAIDWDGERYVKVNTGSTTIKFEVSSDLINWTEEASLQVPSYTIGTSNNYGI
jgi:hypothetical protein